MDTPLFIIAESRENRISQETFELITFAREIADGRLPGIILLGGDGEEQARLLAERTGCTIHHVQGDHLGLYTAEAYCEAILEAVSGMLPAIVLLPHSSMGSDLAPRLAVKMGASCIPGVEKAHGRSFTRSVCSGRFLSDIMPLTDSVVVTVVPGASPPYAPETCEAGTIEKIPSTRRSSRTRALGIQGPLHRDSALRDAEVIVSAGRGVGKKENMALISELASFFPRSAVGGSRPVCDLGWLDYARQIGTTGQTVAPKVYIACGISGALQHVAGMKGAQVIVAVNTDPEASIFRVAHYCIVEDITTFIPVLLEELNKEQ
jgi:electron transfer flavoprotein alpha subunit